MVQVFSGIRWSIILGLLLLPLVYALANYAVIQLIVTPRHLQVEEALAQQEVERITEALFRETQTLDTMAHDWAAWDDTYAFVQRPNQTYIDSNLSDTTQIDNGLNLVCILALDGASIWCRQLDLETGGAISLQELPEDGLPEQHPLLDHRSVDSAIAGLIKTRLGPMLVASRPILTSENEGPAVGTLLFGRLLTKNLLARLQRQTRTDFHIAELTSQKASSPDIAMPDPPAATAFRVTEDSIFASSLLRDFRQQPQWSLVVQSRRAITTNTREIMRFVLLSNSAIGVVVLMLFLLLYRLQLTKAARDFRGLIDQALPTGGRERRSNPLMRSFNSDEFSRLSQDLRRMIAGYEQTREHQNSVITRYNASWRRLNTMLIEEIKQRLKIERHLQKAQEDLEQQVHARTGELRRMNTVLQAEIEIRRNKEQELTRQGQRLRELSSELMQMEDRERRQLATDLHDRIGQSLSVVKMYLDALSSSTRDEACLEMLVKIGSIVEQTLEDTRTLTFELSPPILYELGLPAALDWLAEDLQDKHPLAITIDCDSLTRGMDHATLTLIFRTIRELLFNVVRHAEAERAEVRVRPGQDVVHIQVSDNGRGMEMDELEITEEEQQRGFGLFSIRERVRNIGGKVRIESKQGRGTTIELTIPATEHPQGMGEEAT